MNQRPDAEPRPREDIQANLARASKFADGWTRDWTLFCFFRVLPQWEMLATVRRMQRLRLAREEREKAAAFEQLKLDFANPSLANAGRPHRRPRGRAAARPFHSWLHAMVSAEARGLTEDATMLMKALKLEGSGGATGQLLTPDTMMDHIQDRLRLLSSPEAWLGKLAEHGRASVAGMSALSEGLAGVLDYEVLRQCAPAYGASPVATVRSESEVSRTDPNCPYDPVPSNIVFSWSGLEALGVNKDTLASFPEPFRDGMARRAPRLRDRGPSAPANWESSFGLSRMHGYFSCGYLVGEPCPEDRDGSHRRVKDALWRRLRADIEAFNAPDSHGGWSLRTRIGALFRPFGLEIIHVELGQDPYEVDKDGYTCRRGPRVEHFGFRDGLSQPFADLRLRDPGPGQGTPSRNRTWSPVAPGELYLNLPDEDGQVACLPDNKTLRCHGTYVVFRKLEQDVVGFRSFLADQAQGGEADAKKLAAEFVGRWPSGTPLVLSPDTERTAPPGREDALNDFLFAADDPKGAKCPLSAHIRRANPRDTGGRGEARRHRVLRRGISYGGSLLPLGSLGDGVARGMLFVAINSRIDLQFEVVQADWLNSGEFLGQAGLGRCPVVGHHAGGPLDSFRRAGEAAPLTGIPSFVTLRGGEYFFAPGIRALKAIARGETFPPQDKYYGGYSLGDARTLGLFDRERLRRYVGPILGPSQPTKTLQLPGGQDRMVFVGRYADVVNVLSGGRSGKNLAFSVEPYHQSALRITRGYDLIISTDNGGATADTRVRLKEVRDAAWATLNKQRQVNEDIREEVTERLEFALRRCGPVGRIDLVDDLAVAAAYGVVSRIFGVRGPKYLTELAPTLPFGRQRLTDLPADWLKAMKSIAPSDPGLMSLQIWSTLVLGDTIGNLTSAQEVWPISAQAGAEMLAHIDSLLAAARPGKPASEFTLVDAFVANAKDFVGPGCDYPDKEAYFREAAVILAEATANMLAATPGAFGAVMQFLLEIELPLTGIGRREGFSELDAGLAEKVIYECDRLNPVLPLLQRLCVKDTKLPSGAQVKKDDRIAALVQAANLDERVFTGSRQFRTDRPTEKYLMFGSPSGERMCWGRGLAMAILTPCLLTAASLKDLRRVAGEAGEPRKILDALTIGLPARFTPVRPDS